MGRHFPSRVAAPGSGPIQQAAGGDGQGRGAKGSAPQEESFFVGLVRVYRRNDKYWADYTRGRKRHRHSLKTRNRRTAREKARAIDEKLTMGELPTAARKSKQETLSVFLPRFQKQYTGWAPSTMRGSRAAMNNMVERWGDLLLHEITPEHFAELRAELMHEKGRDAKTANRYLSYIRRVLNVAVEWGYLDRNPLSGVPRVKEDENAPDPVSDEDLAMLTDALPSWLATLVIIAVGTGMRSGELFSLEWSQVDMAQRQVTVRKAKSRRFRVLPMTESVYEAFVEQRSRGVIPYVFCKENGEKITSVQDELTACSRALGIQHVHMHRFRHTAGMRLRKMGAGVEQIASFLGHSTLVMALRYSRAHNDESKKMAALLDQYEERRDSMAG